ncbi:threonine synthase [PVC group bacterium]|nr:threonine synthase [PVC group bacterium]
MKYISTRGKIEPVSFSEAIIMGLARDGGLLLPDRIPDVAQKFDEWRNLSYIDLAYEIMRIFVDIPDEDLRTIVEKSYSTFNYEDVTPVVDMVNVYILELFHGPTLAFKDVALQFLGNLFEYILAQWDGELNILTATSGDTGSAAIHGVRGKERIRIFVMHPKGKTSKTQELQMTSVLDENVFNMAVAGTFDNCQSIMKSIFSDLEFKDRYSLGTANSINWGRVLAQVVYYFYASFQVQERTDAQRVRFAVPTGNFGDIFAGYIASKMGLPVGKLVLATNENNILARFFNNGDYSLSQVVETLSPSMDIQVASNFERYLYYRVNKNSSVLCDLMEQFSKTGSLALHENKDDLFETGSANRQETLDVIRNCMEKNNYLLDPHTAVGYHVAQKHLNADEPMICLATAHPAKFSEAIIEATGNDLAHHPALDALKGLSTRCQDMPDSSAAVKEYIAGRLA